MDVLYVDLNKLEIEVYNFEICIVMGELDFVLEYFKEWVIFRVVFISVVIFDGISMIYLEFYGVVFIIVLWNYLF